MRSSRASYAVALRSANCLIDDIMVQHSRSTTPDNWAPTVEQPYYISGEYEGEYE